LEKAKHADTTVQLRSGFDQGGRWGIKGVEDLGNGYSVGFILEQGFTADDGNVANSGSGTTSGFTREAFMYVNGDFGKFGAGRTGTLASGAQSNHILTGWALGTGLGLSSWTPMFAYQFAHQNSGRRTHMFGLSAKVAVGGGDVLVGGRYLFGKDEAKDVGANKVAVDGDVRAWNIGAAYIYPLSKRTALKAYAGYADSGKEWKDVENVAYNGYQVYLGMRHSF